MIEFYKYQGTGNDFIIIDDREKNLNLSKQQIEFLCNRRFGIGADGLILLQNHSNADFYMQYFNSDGAESTMCGNGGRCIASFAHLLNIGSNQKIVFNAIDGKHEALILKDETISLKMNDVTNIKFIGNDFELNTGSPHYVVFANDIKNLNLIEWARKIRYNDTYNKTGINVNAVQVDNENYIRVRTYERGVEDETLSCGTGVTACAIAYFKHKKLPIGSYNINVITPGGELQVTYNATENGFNNIWLTGKATYVFRGFISLP
ncbi:MAG: diaminopimelate epimerase [Bacteroidia bacterium]